MMPLPAPLLGSSNTYLSRHVGNVSPLSRAAGAASAAVSLAFLFYLVVVTCTSPKIFHRHHFQLSTLAAFSIFPVLCNPRQHPVPEIFHHPGKELYAR